MKKKDREELKKAYDLIDKAYEIFMRRIPKHREYDAANDIARVLFYIEGRLPKKRVKKGNMK